MDCSGGNAQCMLIFFVSFNSKIVCAETLLRLEMSLRLDVLKSTYKKVNSNELGIESIFDWFLFCERLGSNRE